MYGLLTVGWEQTFEPPYISPTLLPFPPLDARVALTAAQVARVLSGNSTDDNTCVEWQTLIVDVLPVAAESDGVGVQLFISIQHGYYRLGSRLWLW